MTEMEMTQKGGKSMRGVSKFLPVAFAAGGLGVTAATGAGMDGYGIFHDQTFLYNPT